MQPAKCSGPGKEGWWARKRSKLPKWALPALLTVCLLVMIAVRTSLLWIQSRTGSPSGQAPPPVMEDATAERTVDPRDARTRLRDAFKEKTAVWAAKAGGGASVVVPFKRHPPEVKESEAEDPCAGRYVYMYKLPPMYNSDFLDSCKTIHRSVDMCDAFSHAGAGRPSKSDNASVPDLSPAGCWYETDQFSLEITFHARMKEYTCLTEDPDKATLFYIPYYAGLSIFRSLYEPDLVDRDKHGVALVEWLAQHKSWSKHNGWDHLQIVTRVLIDFTRDYVRSDWGCNLMLQSYMRNVTFLGIEATPKWVSNAISIPYPTSFHASSDADIHEWQEIVRNSPRPHLVSFAGAGHGMGAQIRHSLWSVCKDNPQDCRFIDCRNRACIMKPQNVMWPYLSAHFCFQPPGDTPTRKGMWDCMLAGGIPVVFHDETAFIYYWHLPGDYSKYLVYIPEETFWKDGGKGVLEILKQFTDKEVEQMRRNIIALIPQLTYAMPGNTIKLHKDALDVAVEGALQRVTHLGLSGRPGLSTSSLLPALE